MIDAQTILIVEDEENDIFFLRLAFQEAGMSNPLQVVMDGQQAIDYLAGEGAYADRQKFPVPGLVLLDLKLPIKHGFDVLRWIQEHPQLASLLVIVLTSSSDPQDIETAYRLGARSYLLKPCSNQQRVLMVQALKNYWLELNQPASPVP